MMRDRTSSERLARWSLLPGMAALTLVMALATDVIVDALEDAPAEAVLLTVAAVAAISMAGSVLSAQALRPRAEAA